MCLIAYQPCQDKSFSRHIIRNGWESNPDGAGYMFTDGEKVVIRKPFFKVKHLIKSYERDHKQYGQVSPFVLHFRWATHGSATTLNIHPHSLDNGKAGLVHNGVLSHFLPPSKADISDTVWFCCTVLHARDSAQLVNPDFGASLGKMIGTGNKLVIMESGGIVSIVNENMGEWNGVRWYSNDSYCDCNTVTTTSIQTVPTKASKDVDNATRVGDKITDALFSNPTGARVDTLQYLYDYHFRNLAHKFKATTDRDFDRVDAMAWAQAEEDLEAWGEDAIDEYRDYENSTAMA